MLKETFEDPKEPHSATENDQDSALEDVLSRPISAGNTVGSSNKNPSSTLKKIDGVMIGSLVAVEGVKVDYPGNPKAKPLTAISTRAVDKADIGKQVALAFVGGDPEQPILLGLVEPSPKDSNISSRSLNAQVDGESLLLTGDKQVVLRCGKSSITLTKEGKIILRGKYLLSRSSGVNRIKGGSVQIN